MAYTVAVVFVVFNSRIRYSHAVWHGFVAVQKLRCMMIGLFRGHISDGHSHHP